MQQQYQEDQLGALDIGKEFAKSYFLPWERMKYDPRVWNLTRGGINTSELMPFRKGGMVHGAASGIGKAVNNASKNWGWANTLRGSQTGQDMAETISKMGGGLDLDFNAGVLQHRDGILSANKAKYQDMGWHKKLMQKEKNLMTQLNKTSGAVNNSNKKYAALQNLSKSSDTKVAYRAQTLLRSNSNYAYNIRSGFAANPVKSNWAQKLFTFAGTGNASTYQQEAAIAGKIWGTRKLAQAGRIGMRAARFAGRAASVAGWGMAMYEVGSLMFQGINMVANPIAQAGVRAVDQTFSSLQSLSNPELGGSLELGFLSQGAATERQRAVQAISKSRINGRSMLGNEGAMMHR